MTAIEESLAALRRTVAAVEEQVTALGERMAADDEIDKLAVRSEIDELKEKVRTIQHDIIRIEAQL